MWGFINPFFCLIFVYKKGEMIDKKKFNKFLRKERQMTNSKIMARYAQFKLYLHNKKK